MRRFGIFVPLAIVATSVLMAWPWLVDETGFTPRAQCGAGWLTQPGLIFATNLFDTTIFICYLLIPFAIWKAFLAVKAGKEIRSPAAGIVLTVNFILWCGMTHFMDRMMFSFPIYHMDCAVRGLCALFSFATVLWFETPGRFGDGIR